MSTGTYESTGLATRNGEGAGGFATPATVRPSTIVGVAAEQQRAIAEIQAALTVAQARPRDEISSVDRIKTSCQRVRLAESAEYVYDRGGTEITGATIDLLTVIANHWGNIQFGFRELTQSAGESLVEAFAWDLETNSKRTVVFNVPHKRVTKRGTTTLTDPRDIYELMANNAQRRVRSCLEAIIPPDVVEEAVLQCRATLAETAQVTPDSIEKMVSAFSKLGITKDQLQKRLGRRMDAMQPAQLVNLRRIYKSITDGMSVPGDWFEPTQQDAAPPAPKTAAETAKEALKARSATKPAAETTPEPEPPQEPAEKAPATPTAEAKKPAKGKKAPAPTAESLVEYLKKTFDRDHEDFDLEKLSAAALATGGDYKQFFADVIGRKHANFEHFLVESLQEQEEGEEGESEEAIQEEAPDEILNPVPRPEMDMFGETFEKRIIAKLKTAEEHRHFAANDLKNPDLTDAERAYLTSLALRRAYQIENNLPLTDKIAK